MSELPEVIDYLGTQWVRMDVVRKQEARLAAAEAERDEAREWIRRHYEQWRACSPTAHDMRAEMPWLADGGHQ